MIGVLGSVGDGDLHALDTTIEGIAAWAVVRRDRGSAVLADVTAVISGEDHRKRHGNVPFADLLAVNVQRRPAALAQAAAGIGELHAHLVLTGGQPIR